MRPRPGGFAVLMILWLLALLALIADRMILVGRSETRIAHNLRVEASAEAAADGGVFEAIYRLSLSRPGGWRIDGRAHEIVIAGQPVTIRIQDEAFKINPNLAPPSVLQALLAQLGVSAVAAHELGTAIVTWRTPIRDPIRAAQFAEARRAAGVPATMPGPFPTLASLAAVPGMTDDILARLTPHLTLDDSGGKSPGGLDPAVAAALHAAPVIAPAPPAAVPAQPNRPRPPGTPLHTVTIRALAGSINDPTFERDAVVRLGGGRDYRIIAWSADGDR